MCLQDVLINRAVLWVIPAPNWDRRHHQHHRGLSSPRPHSAGLRRCSLLEAEVQQRAKRNSNCGLQAVPQNNKPTKVI